MKIGHVALSVSSLKRSGSFYGRHFGFKIAARHDFKDKGMSIVMLRNEGLTLELFQMKECKPLPLYRKSLSKDLQTIGVKHFSLEVTDIVGVFRKLKKARVKFETDLRQFASGARYFFIKDPDGMLIEIMEAL